jgi:mycothiol synthase
MRRPQLDDLPALPALPEGLSLRTYVPDDKASLAALLTRAFNETWDLQRVGERLAEAPDVSAIYLIIAGTNELVATASARLMDLYPGSGYLHWVGVDPTRQGNGLGAYVSGCVLRYFKDLGLRDAVVETHDYRLAAVRTYLRLGFVPEPRDREEQQRWARVLPHIVGTSR